jgi:hypothetical protein
MKTERCQTEAQLRACSWSVIALLESELHRADVLVEAVPGLIVAALGPDISTLEVEFACNKIDVIIAIDPGSASELIRRRSGSRCAAHAGRRAWRQPPRPRGPPSRGEPL